VKRKYSMGTAAAAGRSIYETKIGVEAIIRSGGRNPQLKGVVHELLYRDTVNVNPKNILSGTKCSLSSSATAVRDDVLTMRGGKVVGRAQLKDTVSGVSKTVKQASSGKYMRTKLLGTKETVSAYNKAVSGISRGGTKVPQRMSSTGISSSDTSRIAAQTIGGSIETAQVVRAATTSGAAGAAISGAISAAASGVKLAKGEINGREFVNTVTRDTIGGGISAAAGSATAAVVATGAATVLVGTTAPVWVPGALATGGAVAAGTAVKTGWDKLWARFPHAH